MKIGLLVDGRSELRSLHHLLRRLDIPHEILHPIYRDIQPLAPPAQIALAASKGFSHLLRQGADAIVLLIDKEARQECTGDLARAIESEARARLSRLTSNVEFHVVLKVTKFENWLVADPLALRNLPGLIDQPERFDRRVSHGRADAVDALKLLKSSWRKKAFDKIECAVAICKQLAPARAAENSRSFRKLLKTLGHPDYAETARPAPKKVHHPRKLK